MLMHFLQREHAPHPGDEARQRPRELRIVVRRLCEIQRVLPDDGIEGRPDSVAQLDDIRSFALFCPDRVPAALGHRTFVNFLVIPKPADESTDTRQELQVLSDALVDFRHLRDRIQHRMRTTFLAPHLP